MFESCSAVCRRNDVMQQKRRREPGTRALDIVRGDNPYPRTELPLSDVGRMTIVYIANVDAELVARICAGEERAFEQLVKGLCV
jgi:hypothetical protein